jgi:osmotically-inducible protein OsmY
MRTPLAFVALCATSLTGGCVAAGAVGAAGIGMVAVQDRTLGRSIDDAAASNTVKARLLALDNAGYARVDIEMAEGTLLLSGTTPTAEHKAMAERIAWSVQGVNDVANEIVVGRNPGMLRSGLDNFITAQVRTKILADAQVKGVNYNIETQKGVVYLMGVARSEEELQRAATSASMVRGVERVVSYVTVRPHNTQQLAAAPQGAVIERRTPGQRAPDAYAQTGGAPQQGYAPGYGPEYAQPQFTQAPQQSAAPQEQAPAPVTYGANSLTPAELAAESGTGAGGAPNGAPLYAQSPYE